MAKSVKRPIRVLYCQPGPEDPSLAYRRYMPIALLGARQRGRRGDDNLELEDLIVNHGASVHNVIFEFDGSVVGRHGEIEMVDGE